MNDNRHFYRELEKHTTSLEALLGNDSLFTHFPEDWHVVAVDVQNSTQAVKNGFHHDVNLAATGGIIAILNEAREVDEKLNIPYFFGGDGATFIVPDFFLEKTLFILENYRHHVKKNLYLKLKVGSRRVAEVYREGSQIKVAKYNVNSTLVIPIVLGTGLQKAEKMIKSSFVDEETDDQSILDVNLEGMECRWNEIEPPDPAKKILCLLVNCPVDEEQGAVYQQIISVINSTFGNYSDRHPISTTKLKLNTTIRRMAKEMYIKIGKYDYWYLIKNWLIMLLGKYYFTLSEEGKSYLNKVSELSYILMIDGTLNCVISGTQEEIDQLISALDPLERQGKIQYGTHVTYASVLSCYVVDRKEKHIHFVDGADGGYTNASIMFKAKLAAASQG